MTDKTRQVHMFGTFDEALETLRFQEDKEPKDNLCSAGYVKSPAAPKDAIPNSLPDDATKRLEYPMADGLLDYFPNALAAVANLSYVATQQHHPGESMHWARGKSTDHRNKIMRHLVDTGKFDDKGQRHSTMVAWRALALLQEELEEQEGCPVSRASR